MGYARWQCVDRKTLDSVGLHHIPENSADIDIFIGDANSVGKGLGVMCMNQLVRIINDLKTVPLIALTTSEKNTQAKKAFTKAGFISDCYYTVEPFGKCLLMIHKN